MVGQRLTRPQVVLINSIFLVFAPLLLFGWVRRFQIAMRLAEELRSIDPGALGGISEGLIALVSFSFFILILGCIKFMWDIRHPKAE
jgi:hypothetical protein